MPLEFHPARAIYDDTRETIVFMAMSGPRMVRCAVTRDALLSIARRRAQSAQEMLEAYRAHADRIHEIAERKYRSQLVDTDGSVLVLQRDVR